MTPYYTEPGIEIWHGDCRDILPTLGSVDMVFMDPPYGHGNQDGDLQSARVGVKGARMSAPEPIRNDLAGEALPLLDDVFSALPAIMEHDCCCCCCCCGGGPSPTFAWFANRMDAAPWAFFHALVWDKSARGNGMGWRYRRNYEFVMVAHIKGGKLLWADGDVAVPNILRHHPPTSRSHPNEKPVDLVGQMIKWHGGQTILDPFMGSGTTLRAAKDLGRKAIGIELEERYCEIAVKRLRQEVLAI
jgi:site-specific DNA-methyltransferase (adenine-specific)